MQHLFGVAHNTPNVVRATCEELQKVQGQRVGCYKWEATTLEGFIQQLAVGYVARRYSFYVCGRVPTRLTPAEHDGRMLEKFDVAKSKWSRYRRKRRGGSDGRPLANVQYLRYRDFWVLLATVGEHRFFAEHQQLDGNGITKLRQYRDVRLTPICYGGYSVGHVNGKASVRIERQAYRELKTHFIALATTSRSTDRLEREFRHAPFEPYGGVMRQMFAILRAVNRTRKTAGLPPVSRDCIRVRRRAVKPFEQELYRLAA